jgi:uncharacterized membrane protein YfcA
VLTAAVLLSVVAGTLAQSVSGIGFALVCAPLLVALLGPQDGVRLAVLLSLVLNVVLLARLWRDVDPGPTLLLLVPSALATPLFAVLAGGLPERSAALLAGTVVVVGVALLASGLRWQAARGPAGAVAAGVLGAGTNVLASVAGPVVALWAANADWPQRVQRASLQAYFLGLNCVALPALGAPRVTGPLLAGCLVALAAGAVLGVPLARRVSEQAARRTTLALAGAGGGVVLLRALVGGAA